MVLAEPFQKNIIVRIFSGTVEAFQNAARGKRKRQVRAKI